MAAANYLTVDHLDRATLARIFSKITINANTGCWEWTAAKINGYGVIWFRGRNENTHRLIYAWLVEPLPRGIGEGIPMIDHVVCDNPPCCNPAHLKAGTVTDNLARTQAISAINRRKTHCKRGHKLPAQPNRRDCVGRQCQICRKQQCADYYQRVAKTKQRESRAKQREHMGS